MLEMKEYLRRKILMITANLNKLHFLEGWIENDPSVKSKVAFPFYKATGTETISVVYFELEPGYSVGTHQDSAEEVVLVLQGTAEATLGEEKGQLSQGEMALIPEMVPHNVRNIGSDTLKVVGIFSTPSVVSTFEQPIMPINQRTAGAPPIPNDQPMPWNEIFSTFFQPQ